MQTQKLNLKLESTTPLVKGLLPAIEREEFVTCLRKRFKKNRIDEIVEVAEFAALAHQDQVRQNGAPYITHPLAVASIISEWLLDADSINAALLHDVIEDSKFTVNDIENKFSKTIAQIVNGVSKIEKIEKFEENVDHHEHTAAESYRKLLLAISQDWRVILIKLADRLHNMRTLGNIKSRTKQRRIAQETLDIYAPIAERLGFQQVRDELQSLAFEYIHPVRYAVLKSALERSQDRQRTAIPKIEKKIKASLKKVNIKADIKARSKNIYSVYRKMIEKHLSFNEVDDIIGFRVIADNRLECYSVLGVIHEIYRPVPEKLKDYIAQPKLNGYQSIHTTVVAQNGNIIELQIRDPVMDRLAEFGVAAHWDYKDSGHKKRHNQFQEHTNKQLNSLFSLSKLGVEPGEFLQNIRLDLYPNDVLVLTPKGKVIQLSKGATVLDMAFAIHSDLGMNADYALVNNTRVPTSTVLASGDIVNIFASDKVKVNPQWLSFVVTSKARTSIRNALKESWSDELVGLGKELLERSVIRHGFDLSEITTEKLNLYLKHNSSIESMAALYSQIALGFYHPDVVIKDILGPAKQTIASSEVHGIPISGDHHSGIIRAECCEPLPPEEIVGIMKKNQGINVHRKTCSSIAKQVKAKNYITMEWDTTKTDAVYRVNLALECTNRKGLLANVLSQFAMENSNVVTLNLHQAEENNPVANIAVVVEVANLKHLEQIFTRLHRLNGVSVRRPSAES